MYWFCILQLCWIHWFSSVQLLSHVWLFANPWTAAHQASLSITNSQSLLKLMSIESVMPSSHLILCRLLLPPSIFPTIRVFFSESVLPIRWPKDWNFSFSIVLPVNIQDWFPLGWTGCISLQSKGLSRVFSNTTVQKHQFFWAQLSLITSSNFLILSLGFSMYSVMLPVNSESFMSSFPIWISFLFLLWLMWPGLPKLCWIIMVKWTPLFCSWS